MTEVQEATIEELKNKLIQMGPTEEREFEEAMADLVTQKSKNVLNELQELLETEEDPDIRFRAFFGLTLFHRRYSNYTEFKKLVDDFIDNFAEFKLRYHVLALLHKFHDSPEEIQKALTYSREAVNQLSSHAGVLHSYCETVASALEENTEVDKDDQGRANALIERAIFLRPHYAKFYCTKGRLLALDKKFQEAKVNINLAIDMESSGGSDYSLRISTYRNFLVQFKTLELYDKVTAEIEQSKSTVLEAQGMITKTVESSRETMEDMKAQNLQMLAFFAAIISFIIGSINVLNSQPSFSQAAMLILVLAGVMTLVNVGFSILISTASQNMGKYVLVSVIGILLVISGLLTSIFG